MKAFPTAILCGASLLALTTGAYAQDAMPSAAAAPTDEVEASVEDQIPAEDIIVSGTRLARDGSASPTPVTVLSSDTLLASNPTSLSDALRDVPQLSGTSGVTTGQSTSSSAQNVGLATGSYADLRRFGPTRTLVLQDGVRLPPNRPEGLVDTNLVPQLLIDRIEIVTGGASAVYGSDAVAGVVNFITNNRYQGIQGVAQKGVTWRGDSGNYRFGLAAGESFFNDKLHVVVSLEHSKNDGVQSVCDRPLGCVQGVFGGQNGAAGFGTQANPYVFYTGVGRSNLSFGGKVVVGPAGLAGMNFDSTGNLVPIRPGTPIGNGFCIGCDGSNNDAIRTTLMPSIETWQGYGHVEYDVTENVTLWGQATWAKSTTSQAATAQANQGNVSIFNGNAFLPANAQAALAAAGPNSSFTLGKQWLSLPHVEHSIAARTLNFVGGLRGELGGFKWDITGTSGKSRTTASGREMNAQRAYAALDAVRAPSGQIVCRVTLTNPGVMPGCVPLNPFGDYTASPEAIAFVQDEYSYYQQIKQKTVSANIGGDIFSWWAGDVSVGVGAEYRKVSLVTTGNQQVEITGVRRGTTSTSTSYFANNTFPTKGTVTVKEVYGEAVIPLLKDIPLVQALELSLAGRHTDYSTSGSVNTWKIGGVWDVVDGVRFRATRSRDIRAPSLFELFAPRTESFIGFTDQLTNTNAAVTQQSGGNLTLRPEKADTTVLGAVLTPRFLPGLTLSVDWYTIDLQDAIAQPFTLQEIGNRCFASGGSDILCSQIERPFPITNTTVANFPTRIFTRQINISRQKRKGVDIELGYRTDLGEGQFSARAIGNIQYLNRSFVAEGAAPIDLAGMDFSKFRGTLNLNYDVNGWSFFLRERVVGARRQDRTAAFAQPKVPAVWFTDVNISKTFDVAQGEVEMFMNVTNLFDKLPRPSLAPGTNFYVPGQLYPSDLTMYDILGRRFIVGARFKF